ncbi:MAG: hypothetical protein K8T89_04230 [Planctomycetes bacterium]|nr:hypothetical protein [Planctomycetota bacterium]
MNGFSSLSSRESTTDLSADRLPDLATALELGRNGLLDRQKSDGHWVGELQGDSILESEYILLMAFLGREDDPRIRQAANYLLQVRMPKGGWGNYPGGPADVSVSVKAYFALKIAGHKADESLMIETAKIIRSLGGAEACNSFTKFYLALLGQTSYLNCPAVPPELMFLPRWFPINIYAMSAWSRTILVPLSVVWAKKPVRTLPSELGIRELFLEAPETIRPPHTPTQARFTWTNFFLRVDSFLKRLERWHLTPFRRWAVRKAVAWMRERYVDSDGVGAIFPPMVYNAVVLRALGASNDDPEMIWAMRQIEDLMIPEGETLRLQPCLSPIWDTTLTLIALADAGLPAGDPSIEMAVSWLLTREIRRKGDWSLANSKLVPGGWCFEYRNGFYPDTDDTAMALIALARTGHSRSPEAEPAIGRAVNWLKGIYSDAQRVLARPLGRELHLRNLASPGRLAADRLRHAIADGPQGCRLAKERAADQRGLGRIVPQLRRCRLGRQGRPHRLANGLGPARPDRRGRSQIPGSTSRHRLAAGNAKIKRPLGRRAVHRHRLPESVLSEVSHVSGILPVDGDRSVSTRDFVAPCIWRTHAFPA